MVKPHALIVPHPGQGHTNPMLKVAKILHQKGFYITFVVNEYVSRLFLKARGPNALDGLPDFKFAPVPDGIDFGDGVPDTVFFCDQLMKDVPLPFFKKFVDELRSSPEVPPITCILCDGHMTYPLDVAEELGVPCALFWTPSACGFLCYCYFRNLVEQGIVPLKVIVPHPAQGHINPMLKVAKLLHQKGFYITFVVNEYVGRLYLKSRGPNALAGLPDFKFAAVPDGVDFGDGLPDPIVHCDQLMKDVPYPFFKKFVDELGSSPDVPPITCVVCDGNMTFALKAAEEIGVPCALFWTPSACGFLCYSYFHKLVEQGILPLKGKLIRARFS
ncbi:hypothetical protein RHSIM_Rhsim07G0203500 [Rhododendron simsii]|uniref:Uncharacterized protein n=1 Tax=Rhododendron simsii TaxID=118357 RepID=A0A834GN87_RHOSS|nr:hypothetical protein RHSIM_Rhsim07G0203500 [Rhododendron simsii]